MPSDWKTWPPPASSAGAALSLEPDAPISEKLRDLRDLQVARKALIKERTRLKNRGKVQTNDVLKRQTKARLKMIERQIAELDAEIAQNIAEDKSIARKREILCSILGVEPVSAALILTSLTEIGTLERKQAGGLAGLVPHSPESGQWKAKSFISGGAKPLRDALYTPAWPVNTMKGSMARRIGSTLSAVAAWNDVQSARRWVQRPGSTPPALTKRSAPADDPRAGHGDGPRVSRTCLQRPEPGSPFRRELLPPPDMTHMPMQACPARAVG